VLKTGRKSLCSISSSQRALAFVLDDCEVQDDETYQDLFGDLINKIEDKVNKEEYEWLEAKLQEKELD